MLIFTLVYLNKKQDLVAWFLVFLVYVCGKKFKLVSRPLRIMGIEVFSLRNKRLPLEVVIGLAELQ